MINEFVNMPLDSLKFSFQGVDKKSYEEMRNNKFYDGLIENIKKMYQARGKRELPYLHVSTSITYETPEQVNSFKELLSKYTDLVTVGRTIMEYVDIDKIKLSEKERNTLISLKKEESVVKEHPQICPEVYHKLSINWDGTVTACCGDFDGKMIVGDISKQSLKEIWLCNKMKYYREKLAEKRFEDFELCRVCYDYAQLTKKDIQNI
jgi:radical SAM protein with 4Fe4S-binding SPASM domain